MYGFAQARAAGVLWDYVRTYRILTALSRLQFGTFLDVGAAEGFTAAVARDVFDAEGEATDLSTEACRRAHEFFRLESRPADIHSLPFETGSFDVVVCAETLEHVTDWRRATEELLRVARNAVVISVPNEHVEVARSNRERGEPHAHIHAFGPHSFDYLERDGIAIRRERIMSVPLRFPLALLEGRKLGRETSDRLGDEVTKLYNRVRPWLRRIPAREIVRLALRADRIACRLSPRHDGFLFVLVKKPESWLDYPHRTVRASTLIEFRTHSSETP